MVSSLPKHTTASEKVRRLAEIVEPEDTLAIVINPDPDVMAHAITRKRIFWRKAKKIQKGAEKLRFFKKDPSFYDGRP